MKTVTAHDYDIRVRDQSFEALIDEFYEPKNIFARRRIRIVMDALQAHRNETILDIGCGVGTFSFHAAAAGARCVGADYSFESLKAAQELFNRFQRQASFVVANACCLPFVSGHFDKIVAADFMEHVTKEDKDAILKEIKRVLKKTGEAVIFTPNGIREKIGDLYWRLRHVLFGDPIPRTDLHFGLTNRAEFERLLKENGFTFRFTYQDVTRPFLARIPGVRILLALNLLWVITDGALRNKTVKKSKDP